MISIRVKLECTILSNMTFTIAIAAIILVLFVLAFVTRRRFGVIALALLAGSYLAQTWAGHITPYVVQSGINLSSLGVPIIVAVTVVITLLPALILLVNSPKYHGKWQRAIAALAFGLLAGVLLVPTLFSVLPSDQLGRTIDTFVSRNRTLLITAATILAIIDLFLSSSKSHGHK